MEINVEELLNKASEQARSFARTDIVVGEEFQMGEFTCKPVIKIGTGFGSGMGVGDQVKGSKKGEGGGAGAAIGVIPVGFLATKGDEISFIPADKKSGLSGLMEKVPDLVEKIVEIKEKKEDKEKKEEEKKK